MSDLSAVLANRLGLSPAAVVACVAAAEAAPPLTPDQSGRLRVLMKPGVALAPARLSVPQIS
jgi:hypothetical protein